jgi:hypothetical protein
VASGLVAPLGSILRQLSKGGGAAGINIDDITVELDKLTRDYPFQVRAYPNPNLSCKLRNYPFHRRARAVLLSRCCALP